MFTFGQWTVDLALCNSILAVALLRFEILLEGKACKCKYVSTDPTGSYSEISPEKKQPCLYYAALCIIHKRPYHSGHSEVIAEKKNQKISLLT